MHRPHSAKGARPAKYDNPKSTNPPRYIYEVSYIPTDRHGKQDSRRYEIIVAKNDSDAIKGTKEEADHYDGSGAKDIKVQKKEEVDKFGFPVKKKTKFKDRY